MTIPHALANLTTEEELEDVLSRPTPETVETFRDWVGDLLILGVGGKMGPSLARLARRSADAAGRPDIRIRGVSRFSSPSLRDALERDGIETISCDLLEEPARKHLPDARNVLLMTAFKFGAASRPDLAWAVNTYLPGLLAERFSKARIVCFSTGNVYPLSPVSGPAPTEATPPQPVGEYGITALGRERLLEYVSRAQHTPVCLLRLNYAVELRYGVLVDLAQQLQSGTPIDLRMSCVNLIWQGSANAIALRSFALASSPARVLNVTGPETLRVRDLALGLAQRLGVEPRWSEPEGTQALLSNASASLQLFGPPTIGIEELLDGVAAWVQRGGATLGKPTKFQVQDGKY